MTNELLIAFTLFALALAYGIVLSAWRDRFVSAQRVVVRPSNEAITVLIPARDAASTLVPLLQDLYAQDIPKDQMEVIVVDDHSSDGTVRTVEGMCARWPQLRVLPNKNEGKKAAISIGVRAAEHELVLLTDADARTGPSRVRRIRDVLAEQRADLLILPVRTAGNGSFLGRLQEEEQAGLAGMAVGAALTGWPSLASGANLAFRRHAFKAVGGYAGDELASGDDIFLVQRMHKAGMRITGYFHPDAVVTVEAESTWRGAFDQRSRWAGKMRAVRGVWPWLGVFALVLPWAMLWSTWRIRVVDLLESDGVEVLIFLLLGWLLWLLPVVNLVSTVRRAFQQRTWPIVTAFCYVLFALYSPVIALVALFHRPRWKGRPT